MARSKKARVPIQPAAEAPFLTKLWLEVEPSTLVILGEYARFFILLAGAALMHVCVRGLAAIGVAPERITVFETLDYWATLVLIGMFMLSLIYRVAILLFLRRKAHEPPQSA